MRYNINSNTSVDTKTGETGRKVFERFLSLRTVDNFEWMINLSVTDIRAILFICIEANKDGELELTPRMRAKILKKLGVKERMFYNILAKLQRNGLVKKEGRSYYRLAPFTAYRFHSREMSERIGNYLAI